MGESTRTQLLRQYYETDIQIKTRQLRDKQQRNAIYAPARDFDGRYLILMGGAGSGKSYEVADMILDRIVYETSKAIGKPHRILCCRSESKRVSESQFPLLCQRIAARYPQLDWKISRSKGEERIQLADNRILFTGLNNVDMLKSIFDITSIWIEEADQVKASDFRELDRRLRGYPGTMQIVLSFNPTSVTSWINHRFFRDRDARTLCIRGHAPYEDFTPYHDLAVDMTRTMDYTHPVSGKRIQQKYYHTMLVHSTYLDNRFIDDHYYAQMEDLKRHDDNDYRIYALGHWGIVGRTFFHKAHVEKRLRAMEEANAGHEFQRGEFVFDYVDHAIVDRSIRWVDDPFGAITLYELPRANTPYVMGADTAGMGSDWNAAIVINNLTGCDAAAIHMNVDEDLYARQMYCLGRYYGKLNNCANNALIAVEVNHSTHPVKELERWGYDNLYIREEAPDSFAGHALRKLGFHTNRKTRPLMLDQLRTLFREEPDKIRDLTLLKEAITFTRNALGRPEAMNGHHDDMIMARAIALYVRSSQYDSEMDTFDDVDLRHLPEALQDDYYNEKDPHRQLRLLHEWRKDGLL